MNPRFYFSFFFIVCFVIILGVPLKAQCDRARDSIVLVNLFLGTKGDNWAKKTNWHIPGQPINTWYGVVVDNDGCVAELNLNSNKLEGILPQDITQLQEITKLQLNDNRLTVDPNRDSLPQGWSQMQNLEVLNLSSNILGGPVIAELGDLTNLKVLNLSLNYFSKNLPSNLGNLQNIQRILFNQNEITGNIPSSFGQLSNLEELILSQNKFSGTLPKELGNLVNLRVFSISQNQFSGDLPPEIGSLSSMQFMYFNENLFTGNIPATFGNLSNLRELWLNNNQLSGTIVPEIAMATNLKKLILNNNALSGNIPDFLSSLVSLSALHLSNNKMTGILPESICDLVNLESLLLNNNLFTGTLPTNIGNLVKMTNFQIHNNQITGELPESLGNLTNLQRIYFHNNLLSGCFPESYGKFCSLKFNTNTNVTGYNFLGNDDLLFQGDFEEWCSSGYKVNGNFVSNAPVCEGNTLQLEAESLNMNYVWQGPDGFTSSIFDPKILNFNILQEGDYFLTVTDGNGCKGTSKQTIEMISNGDITVNTPICEGKTIAFTVSQGLSYQWSGPNNFFSTQRNPIIPNATKSMEGIYVVKIETTDCILEKEVVVALTTIGEVGNPEPACVGNDIQLSASGGLQYLWSGPQNFVATTANPVLQNINQDKTGIYTVDISDNTGCLSSYDVEINVIEPEIPMIDPLDDLCQNSDDLLLPEQQGEFFGTWEGSGVYLENNRYYFDPASQKGETELTFLPLPSFVCVSDGKTQIFVHHLEVTGQETSPNTSPENDNASFLISTSGSGNIFTVSWNGPVNGNRAINPSSSTEVANVPSGTYAILLENDLGCLAMDTIIVQNFYSSYFIPNAIRKNSNNPTNQVFTVSGDNIYYYDLKVYDRWGNLAYTSENSKPNDPAEGWNIQNSNLQSGVYVVIITLDLPSGKKTILESVTIFE